MQPADIERAPGPRRAVLLALLLLAAALVLLGLFRTGLGSGRAEFHATAYEPVALAPDFTLTDHAGAELSLADLRGSAVLLFFGYTHCPDVCPLTLARLRTALDAAGAAPEDARILLVTVDPARDTPEVLARYVTAFGDGVTGLTGEPDTLKRVYGDYGVGATSDHADPSMVMHTSAVFGIDRRGNLRVLLRPDVDAAELAADVETLLAL